MGFYGWAGVEFGDGSGFFAAYGEGQQERLAGRVRGVGEVVWRAAGWRLLGVGLLAGVAGAQGMKLIPMPREVRAGAVVPLLNGVRVVCAGCSAEDQFAADDLQATLKERGVPVGAAGAFAIELVRAGGGGLPAGFDEAMRAEGYTISGNGDGAGGDGGDGGGTVLRGADGEADGGGGERAGDGARGGYQGLAGDAVSRV